jgi:exodeoxyribonuclease-5
VFGVAPADYADIKAMNAIEQTRERVRLWYVAATRARDLLVLPRLAALPKDCWATLVDLDAAALPVIVPDELGEPGARTFKTDTNGQTEAIFAAEAGRIFAGRGKVSWRQPSRTETDAAEPAFPEMRIETPLEIEPAEVEAAEVVGSTQRGIILHKLMEEVVAGETVDDLATLEVRATELKAQLGIDPTANPQALELAATVLRTLALPAIQEMRPRLVAELPVFGSSRADDGEEILTSGQADAVALDDAGVVEIVVDWKSDVDPSPSAIKHYRQQLGDYCRLTRAKKAMLVFMTSGTVVEVTSPPGMRRL